MKTYHGDRTIDGIVVTVNGAALDDRRDIVDLSDDGFEWSFEGDAPAQLALAILADHLGDAAEAKRLYQPFMHEIVANFANEWTMTSDDVAQAVAALGG